MSRSFPLSAFACVPIALGLAYVPHFVKMIAARKKLGGAYDVRNPRVSVQQAIDDSPAGRLISRSVGCHQNGIETFSYFSIGVALATIKGVPADIVDRMATAFVALRVVYTWLYITGEEQWKGPSRSVVWALSMVVPFYLTIKAARA